MFNKAMKVYSGSGCMIPNIRRERVEKVVALLQSGMTTTQVGKELGISAATVSADVSVLRMYDRDRYEVIRGILRRRKETGRL